MSQFQGDYAPENWTFSSQDIAGVTADGSIDLSNMPTGFTLTGNDDDLAGANSLYTITVPQNGTLKFRWSYTTNDGPMYDRAGYKLNGTFVELTDQDGNSDQNGEQYVTVSEGDVFSFVVDATDACCGRGNLTIDAFSTADNTPPTLNALSNIISDANPGQIDVNLEGITAGIMESAQVITITATSSDPAVIPNPTITYSSPDATGTLSFTPVTDAFGDVTITVNVMDDGGTANGSIDNIDVTFDVTITGNQPPLIDIIADRTIQVNEVLSVDLTGISAGTGETQTVTVAATSSNQTLITDGSIGVTYTSPDATGTLDITPVANASGEAIITVTVSDDGGVADNGKNETTTFFTVTVTPNGEPTITPVTDLNLFVNAGPQVVNLMGIGDGDSSVDQTLTLTATSDNPSLLPDPVVSYTSPDATGTLTLNPVADQFGTATITVTLGDNGGTENGGINETTLTFDVTILGNFAPTLDPLGNILMGVNESDRSINLAGISAGVISNAEDLTVTATSSNTSIIAEAGIQVTYTSPDATGTLVLNPVADAIGETTITVTVTDSGSSDNGGVNTIEETFTVRLLANRIPAVNQVGDLALDINAPEQTINLNGISGGEDSEYQTLTITASSDNTSLIPDPTVTYTSPDAGGTLTFTPVTDAIGTAIITVTVMDDGGTAEGGINTTTMTFTVSVSGNQPPTLDVIGNVERTATGTFSVNLAGISDGTGFTQNLTVTATSDNVAVIPDPTVNYTNGNATGTLDFDALDFGDANITVTVMDDGGTDNGGVDVFTRTFNIFVGGNTPPDVSDWDSGNDLDEEPYYFNNGQGDQVVLLNISDAENTVTTITAVASNPEFADIVSTDYNPGSFIGGIIFAPVSGQVGTETFEISVQDDGGTENNGVDTEVVTMTVIFTEPTTFSADFVSGNSDEYNVQPFTVDQSGVTLIESLNDSYENDDVSFQLYETSFNESNQTENRLANGNRIIFELEKDKQYVLVTYNEGNGTGNSTNAIGLVSGNVGFGFLPNLDFIDNVSLDEDASLIVPLSGMSDGNGGTTNLTLSATGDVVDAFDAFDFINNDDGTGSVQINPAADVNGSFQVTVTVNGANGNTFDRTFEVTINPINDAPRFTLEDQTIDEEVAFVFDASGTDVDNDDNTLTYSLDATSISNGMSIDASTGSLSWTPTEEQDGTYSVTVTANDGSLDGSITIAVTVNEVNLAPVLAAIGDQVGAEKSELTFTATATDADLPANTLQYSLDATSISNGMAIDASTGVFTWTPDHTQAGTYTVEIIVSDGSLDDAETIAITIDNVLGANVAESIEVYPNPATNYLKVTSSEVALASVYNLNGAKVLEAETKGQIDITDLKIGTYILQLRDKAGRIISTNRIVKQ